MESLFEQAEEVVSAYFAKRLDNPEHGTIEIFGERYVLVRAASLSVEFFSMVRDLLGPGRQEEADDFTRHILFDLAHAIGKSDARNFHAKMNLKEPIARLSAGPVHFSHAGWAFVDILPESTPGAAEDYYLIYNHPYSFESDAWSKAGQKADFPVCIMNAGYSSGWCEESFGIELVASEILCKARGDDCCQFIMAHPNYIEARISAYGEAQPDPSRILKANIPDFFARKRLEDDLRLAHDELEQRVALRTEELRQTNERLREEMTERSAVEQKLLQSQKLEAVGQLAGGVAHDFNNLLTSIGGYADLVRGTLSDDDERSARYVREIIRAVERAGRLTKQLLVFSRQQVSTPEILDLKELVASLLVMLKPLLGEDTVLSTNFEDTPLLVCADRTQIEQVVINLAVNARDAMPGGGKLTIAIDAPSPKSHVRLRVTDEGQGMSPEVLAKAFEPFFTTKPKGMGTGLGLATVYGIIQLSDGLITAQSQPNQGTTFEILLPMVSGPPTVKKIEAPLSSTKLEGVTVLVVEDEQVVREFICTTLLMQKCHVFSAPEAQAAKEIFAEHGDEIQVLLTDVIMPGMSGPELAAELKDQKPDLAIAFVSGYTGDRVDHETLKQAGALFLMKPFSVNRLTATLKEAIDQAAN
jgi:signal transduction histidine kinase/ActR/RegA family two-component response regulator